MHRPVLEHGKVWASALVLLGLASCVTPLGHSEIERLTTCGQTDLKTARRNLLLAGFHIARESSDDLTTDYKQTQPSYGEQRHLTRITVIKTGERSVRFLLRHKDEGYRSVQTGETVTSFQNGKNADQRVNLKTSQNQLVRVENEYDQAYYQEHLGEYEAHRQMVCGR